MSKETKYAKYRCTKCKEIFFRALGYKVWTPSYCGNTDKKARLYRISDPIYSEKDIEIIES